MHVSFFIIYIRIGKLINSGRAVAQYKTCDKLTFKSMHWLPQTPRFCCALSLLLLFSLLLLLGSSSNAFVIFIFFSQTNKNIFSEVAPKQLVRAPQ